MGQNWAMNPWNANMNGSNSSLNLPMQGYYPQEQQMWMNAWGQPGIYPYPMPPNMMNGEFAECLKC